MDITILESKVRFKAPETGKETKPIADHYNGRRVTAEVNGEEQTFRFDAEELDFEATEEDIENAIEQKVG